MTLRLWKKVVVSILLTTPWASNAFATYYVVTPGDTLAKIARKVFTGRVWGKTGRLEKLLALNPKRRFNPNLLLPGQLIKGPGGAEISAERVLLRRPAATAEKERSSDPYGRLSLDTGFSSSVFSATDSSNGASGRLVTTSNFTAGLEYGQHWSDDFESAVYFGLQSISLNPPSLGGSLSNPNPTLYHFGMQGLWSVSPRLKLGGSIGLNQDPFLIGLSSSGVIVDLLYVPTFHSLASYELYQKKNFTLGTTIAVGIAAPATGSIYQSQWNPDYGVSLYVQQRASSWLQLETGFRGDYQFQNTTVSTQSQTDLGVYFKVTFLIGGGL